MRARRRGDLRRGGARRLVDADHDEEGPARADAVGARRGRDARGSDRGDPARDDHDRRPLRAAPAHGARAQDRRGRDAVRAHPGEDRARRRGRPQCRARVRGLRGRREAVQRAGEDRVRGCDHGVRDRSLTSGRGPYTTAHRASDSVSHAPVAIASTAAAGQLSAVSPTVSANASRPIAPRREPRASSAAFLRPSCCFTRVTLAGMIAGNARNMPANAGPMDFASRPVITVITPPNANRTAYSHQATCFSFAGSSLGLTRAAPRATRPIPSARRRASSPCRGGRDPHREVLALDQQRGHRAVDQHRDGADQHPPPFGRHGMPAALYEGEPQRRDRDRGRGCEDPGEAFGVEQLADHREHRDDDPADEKSVQDLGHHEHSRCNGYAVVRLRTRGEPTDRRAGRQRRGTRRARRPARRERTRRARGGDGCRLPRGCRR